MGSLRSQGYLYSAGDVLEPVVRDLQKRKSQGVYWSRRVVGGVMGVEVNGGVGSKRASEQRDGALRLEMVGLQRALSVLCPPALSLES